MEAAWDDPHFQFMRRLQMQRLDQLLANRDELRALRHDPERLRMLTRVLSIALRETGVELMDHILPASEPADPPDEKSDGPQEPLLVVHDRPGERERELGRFGAGRKRVHVDEIRVVPARPAAGGAVKRHSRKLAHHNGLLHLTPYSRFKLYSDCRRVSHWAPDLARTLRTRYLAVALPLALRILLSRFVWGYAELAQMLARELFGHELDHTVDDHYWPNNMVHGNY